MRIKPAIILLLILSVSLLAVGCKGGVKEISGVKFTADEVTIGAASSAKPALTKIAADFERKTKTKVTLTVASSGLIARQIENGAPIDLFLSADRGFVDQLKKKKLIAAGAKPYAAGKVVMIGKARTHGQLISPGIQRIAIANPKLAPYGNAALEVLKYNKSWSVVKDKLVYAENVAQAHEMVKSGNADVGFVALPLVINSETPYMIINQRTYTPIVQWAGIPKSSDKKKAAQAFLKFLLSPASQKTFQSFGFFGPPST